MELWNDFEGKTVAGRFPLEQLLGPQGRSAFFRTTANGSGPAVIRLIESHFDEEEILARWRVVMGLKEANLQTMRVCGETELEGTKLVYAVLEPTEMELADALRERPLTVAETRQVAATVLAALRALHGAGLVHEHVDAESVLAQGDVVKLRSDCVREAPEGAAGDAARAADVRGAALLIVQALTQAADERRAAELPAPFAEMVRKGVSGEWGVAEMTASLEDSVLGPVLSRPGGASGVPARSATVAPARSVTVAPARAAMHPAAPRLGTAAAFPAAPARTADVADHSPSAVAAQVTAREESRGGAALGRLDAEAGRLGTPHGALHARAGSARSALDPVEVGGRRTGVWAGVASACVVVVGLLGWRATHGPSTSAQTPAVAAGAVAGSSTGASNGGGSTKPSAGRTSLAVPARKATATIRAEDAAVVRTQATAASGRGNWRVVAFTYNREDQARHKAEQIAGKYESLRPEAWSPSGRAPYLVSLGGWMDEHEARDVVIRAKHDGMPRDTFARNYQR